MENKRDMLKRAVEESIFDDSPNEYDINMEEWREEEKNKTKKKNKSISTNPIFDRIQDVEIDSQETDRDINR